VEDIDLYIHKYFFEVMDEIFPMTEEDEKQYIEKINLDKIEIEKNSLKRASWDSLELYGWQKFSSAVDIEWIKMKMKKSGVKNYTFIVRVKNSDEVHPNYFFEHDELSFKISVGSECTKISVCGKNGRDGNYIKELDLQKLKMIKMKRQISDLQSQLQNLKFA
jgi:hypothetical protein